MVGGSERKDDDKDLLTESSIEDRIRMDLIPDPESIHDFLGRDVLRVSDFNASEILFALETGRVIAGDVRAHRGHIDETWFYGSGRGKLGGAVFRENSTRTFWSSVVAMNLLGMNVSVLQPNSSGSSQSKGESLSHDMAMYAAYNLDVIVMRHSKEGAPQRVADYFDMLRDYKGMHRPVIINGGDGSHSHPTQAFLDALTYYITFFIDENGHERFSGLKKDDVLSGLTLYGVGDSLKGRTIKDNARLLAKFPDNELVLVGPREIRMPQQDIDDLIASGLKVTSISSVGEALEHAKHRLRPIFYFMRVQEERLDPRIVDLVRGKVSIDHSILDSHGLLIMDPHRDAKIRLYHPLPMHQAHREIHPALERTPHFQCFNEAEMGPYVRAALIGLTTGIIPTEKYRSFVDPRKPPEDYEKVRPVPLSDKSSRESFFYRLVDLIEVADEEALTRLSEEVSEDPLSAVKNFIMGMADHADTERFRHLSFHFIDDEDGTVYDKIPNGKTGLVKYTLDLSSLIERTGHDGKPVVVSAVDGLTSSSGSLKGVIKIRGVLLPPETIHYLWLIGDNIRISHIRQGKVVAKYEAVQPLMLKDFNYCSNPLCVTNVATEHAPTIFYKDHGESYRCHYCDNVMTKQDILSHLIKSS